MALGVAELVLLPSLISLELYSQAGTMTELDVAVLIPSCCHYWASNNTELLSGHYCRDASNRDQDK